eukprot:4989360-Karenia_brevis.AAC.1
MNAWLWTEMLLTHSGYGELNCPESVQQRNILGVYGLCGQQSFLAYRIFDSLVGFFRLPLESANPD